MKSEQRVNNDIYRHMGHAWWDDDVGEFSTLRFWINPVPDKELGRRLDFQESDHLEASYMEYAERRGG